MTAKPDLTRIWASGAVAGDIEDPDVTVPGKFAAGWQAEIPPHENFNFLQQLFTQGLAHFNEYGIGQWDTDTDFPIGAWSRSTVDGEVYVGQVTPNVGNEPSATAPTEWKLLSDLFALSDAEKINLKSGRKNYIVNGSFDIWQRGVNFSGAYTYTADRWFAEKSGATADVDQQPFTVGQTDVPNNPEFFLRYDVTAANADAGLEQRIEDVRTLSDGNVALSLYLKADAARTIRARVIQNFGSGGSSSVTTLGDEFNVTTSWQKFETIIAVPSISGKTLGDGNYLAISLINEVSELFTLDIAQVQVEKGNTVTDFEYIPIVEELSRCQRYYSITSTHLRVRVTAGDLIRTSAFFPQQMRIIPAVTITDDGSSPNTSPGSTIIDESKTGVGATMSNAGVQSITFDVTADAEL